MKLVKQQHELKVHVPKEDNDDDGHQNKIHSNLLMNDIRCSLIGPSNCGKSALLIGLLEHPKGIKFQHIYVCGKTLHQPRYKKLEGIIETIPEMSFNAYHDLEEFPDFDSIPPFSVCVFDDLGHERQQGKIQNIFSYGRHKGLNSFYCCQTYCKIPKHLIRDNMNLLILFKMDLTNLRHIYEEHVVNDVSFKEFLEMCSLCWKNPYGFMVICPTLPLNNGRYRHGFDEFFQL